MSTSSGGLERIATITQPLAGAAHKVEGGLGMFFGTLLTLMLAGLIVLMTGEMWTAGRSGERAIWLTCASGWMLLDVPYLVRLWRVAFAGPPPITYEAAARQRMAPVILRPAITLWWFAHFALAALASVFTTSLVLEGDPVLVHSICFLLATSYGYAANGYLMNAVCALTRSPNARLAVWRRRGLIDVALGVIGALLPAGLLK
jgi:hypothetical protein